MTKQPIKTLLNKGIKPMDIIQAEAIKKRTKMFYSNVDEYKNFLEVIKVLEQNKLYDDEFFVGYNLKEYFDFYVKSCYLKNLKNKRFDNDETLQNFLYELFSHVKESISYELNSSILGEYNRYKIDEYLDILDDIEQIDYVNIMEYLNSKYFISDLNTTNKNYILRNSYKIKYVDKEKNNKIAKIENDIKILAYELKIMLNELQELKNS